MGLLSRKPAVKVEEFCEGFYDSQIFHAIIAGADVSAGFWEFVLNSVREADPSFATDDLAAFRREMTALRVELFGLAWVHQVKREEFTPAGDHLHQQLSGPQRPTGHLGCDG